jgi:hypothetical protein
MRELDWLFARRSAGDGDSHEITPPARRSMVEAFVVTVLMALAHSWHLSNCLLNGGFVLWFGVSTIRRSGEPAGIGHRVAI